MPIVAGLAVAACGGKVVVDGEGSGGSGGTSPTQSSAAVNPSTSSSTQSVCDAGIALLKTCDPTIGEVPPIPDCQGMLLCQFTCIVLSNCAAIVGTDIAGTQKLAACLMTCT